MNIQGKPIFDTIPDEEFVDRKRDIDNLFKLALETSNNTTHSIYLYGERRVGKTEVLKRVYNRLFWEQREIIPFYYTLNKEYSDILEFARDYLTEFIKQYLGFIKKQPSLIRNSISLHKLLKLIGDEEYPKIKELIVNYHEYTNACYSIEALKNSILAPYTVSVEGYKRAFVILDDFHRIKQIKSPEIKHNILEEFSRIINNRFSPHLITGDSMQMAKEIFSDIGDSDVIELKGLDKEDIYELFKNMCELHRVKFSKEYLDLMVSQLAFSTFYVKSFIRSAKRSEKDIKSLKDFQKLYIDEVTSGNFSFYFSSMLNSFVNENDQRVAMKILKACVEAPKEGLTTMFLSDIVVTDLQTIDRVLNALQEGNFIEISFGRVRRLKDPVLRDFVLFAYSTMLKGQEPLPMKILMVKNGLKELFQNRNLRFSENIKGHAEKTLDSMDCQKIPESLFDFKSYSSLYGQEDFAETSEMLKNEQGLLSLPQIIGVSEILLESTDDKLKNIFFAGYGFEDKNYDNEQEMLWLLGIFPRTSVVGVGEVEALQKQVDRINTQAEIPKTTLWIIAKDGFTDEAIEKINNNKIKYSNLDQLYHLRDFLSENSARTDTGEETTSKSIEKNTSAINQNEFELTIPMASDTELVAVRAIEEIARRADFDQDSIGQIKMAIIEACINATEHSKMKGGKISIKSIVEDDKLIVYVYNKGLSFDSSLIPESNIDIGKKILSGSHRGWGIKLMKSFMDEVEFEKATDGTKLKMTKLIRRKKSSNV